MAVYLAMAKKVPLFNSKKKVTVDNEDYKWVRQWSWFLTEDGYAARLEPLSENESVLVYMHEEIYKRAHGLNHYGQVNSLN